MVGTIVIQGKNYDNIAVLYYTVLSDRSGTNFAVDNMSVVLPIASVTFNAESRAVSDHLRGFRCITTRYRQLITRTLTWLKS